MVNPYKLTDGRKLALIQGYVIDAKDRGDVNMLLFKKDTQDPSSKLISVAAWALAEGQSGADMREMTKDTKGKFVVCVVKVRDKEKDGKLYAFRLFSSIYLFIFKVTISKFETGTLTLLPETSSFVSSFSIRSAIYASFMSKPKVMFALVSIL